MHYDLSTPLSLETVVQLSVGDTVALSGSVITARDKAHKLLVDPELSKSLPFDLSGSVIYHCGPIIRKVGDTYSVVAAGPTTSSRLDPYEDTVIQKYRIPMVIGKAGMGEKTLAALLGRAVYCCAVGGAAQVLAGAIRSVRSVYFLDEFGAPEAFWVFEVRDFPVVVTMDSHGNSLHKNIRAVSERNFKTLLS